MDILVGIIGVVVVVAIGVICVNRTAQNAITQWLEPISQWIQKVLLKELFDPSYPKVCEQLSREIGAELVRGNWPTKYKVRAKEKEWIITLDLFLKGFGAYGPTDTYTRITAPFVNKDSFRFAIYSKTLFSGMGKLVGMQDIEVGYPELDRDFNIKSNSVPKVMALLENPVIRGLIRAQPSIDLKSSGSNGLDVLHFQEAYVIEDVQRLKSLFELFGETLRQLCSIGSASEEPPIIPE